MNKLYEAMQELRWMAPVGIMNRSYRQIDLSVGCVHSDAWGNPLYPTDGVAGRVDLVTREQIRRTS